MRRYLFEPGILTAVLLAVSLPVSAQDSFLEEFRMLPRRNSTLDSPSGLVFMPNAQSDGSSAATSTFGRNVDNAAPQSDATIADQNRAFHSAGLTVNEICADEFCTDEQCGAPYDCDAPLVRFRNTCFQGLQVNYGHLSGDPDTGLVVRTLETYGTFAVPLDGTDNVISFTPYIRADFLQAAAALDLPDTLYDTGVKMFWRRPINERLGANLLITPSVRSDFQTSEGAFRLFGMGLLTWRWIPETLSIFGGVVYTGRDDFPVLPAMGLLWTPAPDWRYDIQFPSPRISHRLFRHGSDSETWAYLSGVFGGNTWAVKRASGASDQLTISDLRLVTGIEHLQAGNKGVFLEIGYVFNRSLEYKDVPFQQDLDASWMLRTGISY